MSRSFFFYMIPSPEMTGPRKMEQNELDSVSSPSVAGTHWFSGTRLHESH